MSSNSTNKLKQVDGLDVCYKDGICIVRLNKPKKLNAIDYDMYIGIQEALNFTSNDDAVHLLYITGTGRYFSSGNDLSQSFSNPEIGIDGSRNSFKDMIKAFINYPKLVVVGVNGPAVGVAVTILPLADFVYASDIATFHTPFTKLGLIPEGCSSYTFPKIMGYACATDILIGSRKLTSHEACNRGLVSDIFDHSEFHVRVEERLKYLSSLPRQSVMYSKALLREQERDLLLNINECECARLKEVIVSEEVINAVMAFMAKNSKL